MNWPVENRTITAVETLPVTGFSAVAAKHRAFTT